MQKQASAGGLGHGTTDQDAVIIDLSSALLGALANWSLEASERLGQIVFANAKAIATDGHRLVQVPLPPGVPTTHAMSIRTAHIRAALAAQAAMSDRPPAGRTLHLAFKRTRVRATIAPDVVMNMPVGDLTKYPASALRPLYGEEAPQPEGRPDGYILNPRYLAAIGDVLNALGNAGHGVQLTMWSRDGKGALELRSRGGARFYIMPIDPAAAAEFDT